MFPFKSLGLMLFLIVITMLMCAMLPYRSISGLIGDDIPSSGGGATCANIGESHSDNPFYGWPVDSGSYSYVSASYCDPYYLQQFGYAHWGIDLAYPWGTPVYATAEAQVTRAELDHPDRGHNIELCENGWCVTYMHLSSLTMIGGETVANRVLLGYMGDTGNTTGAHLHYEIKDPAGNPVDPAPTLP